MHCRLAVTATASTSIRVSVTDTISGFVSTALRGSPGGRKWIFPGWLYVRLGATHVCSCSVKNFQNSARLQTPTKRTPKTGFLIFAVGDSV